MMTAPGRSLPHLPDLPYALAVLARTTLADERATPDHLLVLADALDEVAVRASLGLEARHATRLLAAELRRRAPAFARPPAESRP